MKAAAGAGHELTLIVPDELLQAAAERIAELVLARTETRSCPESPWMDFERTADYLGFSRDRLYKLTAARAIPFRKKRDGHGLLFHRDELDRWVDEEYPATGCAA